MDLRHGLNFVAEQLPLEQLDALVDPIPASPISLLVVLQILLPKALELGGEGTPALVEAVQQLSLRKLFCSHGRL